MYSLATEIYTLYKKKKGSKQIASMESLNGIMGWIKRCKPSTVLEFGPGIGTTTQAIIATGSGIIRHVALEEVAWCRDQLRSNIGDELIDRIEIISDSDQITGTFDFILVDGPVFTEDKTKKMDELSIQRYRLQFQEYLHPQTVVLFEGIRHGQQLFFRKLCPYPWCHKHVHTRKGGYHVYQLTPSLWTKIEFTLARIFCLTTHKGIKPYACKVSPHTKAIGREYRLKKTRKKASREAFFGKLFFRKIK